MQITSTISTIINHFLNDQTDASTASTNTLVGVAINKRYRVTELVGAGETSCLYKGFDRYSDRKVLIKILHRHLVSSRKSLDLFEREAQEITPATYPAIKSVLEKHMLCTGQPYVVMECSNAVDTADKKEAAAFVQ